MGVHPEAPASWYTEAGLSVQNNEDIVLDLVNTAMKAVDLTKAESWTGKSDCTAVSNNSATDDQLAVFMLL